MNAHTDGDTYVYFADANVLSTGDAATIGRYPNIDFANGGSISGMIATADGYLSITDDNTKIEPGHAETLVGLSHAATRTSPKPIRLAP
jgi:glyoxylase-like metal-dependent hydrolase (beta-lactamase superfamily II)